MVSLATTVAGIPLPSCVYNASGPRTGSSAAMSKIAASAAGGVLAKSATVESQTGNPQPRTWQSSGASLNSEGLPNSGIEYYIASQTIGDTMGENAEGKPYMVSISGKNLADNLAMLGTLYGNVMMEDDWKSDLKCILKAADKYGFPHLQIEVDKWYVKAAELTGDNVIDELLYADGCGHDLMKNNAVKFIVDHADSVLPSDSFAFFV